MHDDLEAKKAKESARIGQSKVEDCSFSELVAFIAAKEPKTIVLMATRPGFELFHERSSPMHEQLGMLAQASTIVEMRLKMSIAAAMESRANCGCPQCSTPFTPPGGPLAHG